MAKAPRILVVDDDPDILAIVTYALRNGGYEVVRAYGGEAALRKLDNERFDLIITDLSMPGISGVHVIDAVRRDPLMTGVPVLVMTAFAWDTIARVAGEVGHDGLIQKPFTPKQILEAVRRALRPRDIEDDPDPMRHPGGTAPPPVTPPPGPRRVPDARAQPEAPSPELLSRTRGLRPQTEGFIQSGRRPAQPVGYTPPGPGRPSPPPEETRDEAPGPRRPLSGAEPRPPSGGTEPARPPADPRPDPPPGPGATPTARRDAAGHTTESAGRPPARPAPPARRPPRAPSGWKLPGERDGPAAEPASAGRPPTAAAPAKPRVLVLEDSAVVRTEIERALVAAGFATECAAWGAEAVAQVHDRGEPFEVVVASLSSSGMSPRELCDAIRSEETGRPRVLVLADIEEDPGLLTQVLESGADNYLTRPCRAEDIVSRVRSLARE